MSLGQKINESQWVLTRGGSDPFGEIKVLNRYFGLVGVLFFAHFMLGAILSLDLPLAHQIISVFHTVFMAIVGYTVIRNHDKFFISSQEAKPVLKLVLAVHVGLLLGVSIFDSSGQVLWVTDSVNIHIPGAERVMQFIAGDGLGSHSSKYDRTYLAHIFSGIFFYFFGVNQLASGLGLMIGKLGAVYFTFRLGKELVDYRVGQIASVIYILLPTALFYSVTFYKEATVQFLVVFASFYLLKSVRYWKWTDLMAFFVALVLLTNERHYLGPCFAVAFVIGILLSSKVRPEVKILTLYSGVAFYWYFSEKYWDTKIEIVLTSLKNYRSHYLSYTDVNPINRSLPYPIAVLKLYLSPFFTFGKVRAYDHMATLLTWGSFFYQLVALVAGLVFVVPKIKSNLRNEIVLLAIPMTSFLLVFGYVAPYNGRLRDSFIPLICIYCVLVIHFGFSTWSSHRRISEE